MKESKIYKTSQKAVFGEFRGRLMVIMLFLPLLIMAQQPWTLQQCVDTALAKNRNVKQQSLMKKTKEIAYQQARNNLLPNLNASASQNFNFGRSLAVDNTYQNTNSSQSSVGISSNITLYNGLKMKNNIDARKADMMASEADLEKIKQDITMSVAAGFLQVLLNKELLQIANEQLELSKSKVEQRKGLVAAGKMADGELLELLAEVSKEELNKQKAENALKLSILDLAQILELDQFEKLEITAPENLSESDLKVLSADEVYNSAISHRPEIKGAEYRLKSSESNVLINKADFYPMLNFGAQIGTGYYNLSNLANKTLSQQMSENMTTVLGFDLRIPIFNKFDVRNRVRTAQLNVESSKLNVDNAKLELKKSIQQAYYNALGAKSRWQAAQKSETAGREAFRFTNQKFEAGKATLYELYQAKSNLAQVLSEQAQAKFEYFFRVKMLELLK